MMDEKQLAEIEARASVARDDILALVAEVRRLMSLLSGDKAKVCFPLEGEPTISQAFAHGRPPHVGVDFSVPVGTPVHVIRDGKVVQSAWDSGTYGGYLMVEHEDGYLSLYAHLSWLDVHKGDTVKCGDVIGKTGGAVGAPGAGRTTGPHLHFEVRPPGMVENNKHNVDPLEYITSRL